MTTSDSVLSTIAHEQNERTSFLKELQSAIAANQGTKDKKVQKAIADIEDELQSARFDTLFAEYQQARYAASFALFEKVKEQNEYRIKTATKENGAEPISSFVLNDEAATVQVLFKFKTPNDMIVAVMHLANEAAPSKPAERRAAMKVKAYLNDRMTPEQYAKLVSSKNMLFDVIHLIACVELPAPAGVYDVAVILNPTFAWRGLQIGSHYPSDEVSFASTKDSDATDDLLGDEAKPVKISKRQKRLAAAEELVIKEAVNDRDREFHRLFTSFTRSSLAQEIKVWPTPWATYESEIKPPHFWFDYEVDSAVDFIYNLAEIHNEGVDVTAFSLIDELFEYVESEEDDKPETEVTDLIERAFSMKGLTVAEIIRTLYGIQSWAVVGDRKLDGLVTNYILRNALGTPPLESQTKKYAKQKKKDEKSDKKRYKGE